LAEGGERAKVRSMRMHGVSPWAGVLSGLGYGASVLLACGAQSDGSADRGGVPAAGESPTSPSGSGVPVASGAASSFSQCPTPIGTAEELARTPRSDTNLELLALTLDAGELTATQPTYERVVADVGAIRASAPSLATLAFSPPHDGRSLAVSFGSDATDALGAGTYTAWDCLLEAYRVRVGDVIDVFPTYAPTLYLDGIFDLPRLAQLFGQLPDVVVEMNPSVGGRTLCAVRDGEHYEYVVDETNGQCGSSSECTGRARYFASDSAGDVTLIASWGAVEGAPAPSWFGDVCN
jgi:hypothetical protein